MFSFATHHRTLLALTASLVVTTAIIATTLLPQRPVTAAQLQTPTEASVLAAINAERTTRGLEPLLWNDDLYRAASDKARDMFDRQYFDHIAPDGTTPWQFIQQEYTYLEAGENLAIDFEDSLRAVPAWMSSPAHRRNILDADYKDSAVVELTGLLDGRQTTIIVQLFGDPDLFE